MGGDRRVGGDKRQRGSHVYVNHSAALCDSADRDGFAVDNGLNRPLLFDGVGGHYGFSRVCAAVLGENVFKSVYSAFNRSQGQRLADYARGGYDHVVFADPEGVCRKLSHRFRFFIAVGVAGVGVARIDDHSLRNTVFKVLLRDVDSVGFYQIFCEDSRRRAGLVTRDKRKVALAVGNNGGVVCLYSFGDYGGGRLLYARADPVGGKALRRGYAAVDKGVVVHDRYLKYKLYSCVPSFDFWG